MATAIVLSGCTARQAYDGIQQGKRNKCAQLPRSQQSACLEQANISYEQYQRRRHAARAQE